MGCSPCWYLGGIPALVGNGAGCPRPRTPGGAPHILLRLAHYPGRQRPVLADFQIGREGCRMARATASRQRPRRPTRWRRAGGCLRATPACAEATWKKGRANPYPYEAGM
ncbi:hypothetical protein [Microcoleus sp. F4-D5]|uniref:hypothetical protein n=1 Tax=Microcoleus sp. F4-D5 TaxID=2818760 RepID=UPI002FD5FACF